MTDPRRLALGALWWGLFAAAAAAEPLTVRAVSPRPGLLFTDRETVDVRAAVRGAGAEAVVAYTVAETDGPWRAAGKVALSGRRNGRGTKRLGLKLPGRGLYKLRLSASSGGATATAETFVAVVFAPGKPDPASPWGIFYTPHIWFAGSDPNGPRTAALSHRLLGASWSRLNFWAHSYDKVTVTRGDQPTVQIDVSTWKGFAKALRAEGISILGEVAQCPRALSSQPNATSVVGDAGPLWCRVRPRDYGLWEELTAKLAAAFREEIGVWEVWNEPNLRDRYWTGTVEGYAELVERTARGLRRGNPDARIAAGGFVGGIDFADRLFRLGMGRHIDILSVHYTDERPEQIAGWKRLLAKHKRPLPIWNSEERSEVPLRNLAGGIERSFKFLHAAIGYGHMRPLVRKDWTVLPAGVAFSVGAHCLGTAKYAGRLENVSGYDAMLFRRGGEVIAAFDRSQKTGVVKLFAPAARRVTLRVEALAGSRPTATDLYGRSRALAIVDGRAEVALPEGMLFVNGCRELAVVAAAVAPAENALVFEAEDGRCSKGWDRNAKPGFSGGRILELYKKPDPPAGGYWAELRLRAPEAGRYEVLFSGNDLSRLAAPPSLSPFTWRIDDGKPQAAHGAVRVRHGVPGAPEGLSSLGTVQMAAGEHVFRLSITGRRKQYDDCYALWFDAIVLRKQ
jgi:hypothetical protein